MQVISKGPLSNGQVICQSCCKCTANFSTDTKQYKIQKLTIFKSLPVETPQEVLEPRASTDGEQHEVM